MKSLLAIPAFVAAIATTSVAATSRAHAQYGTQQCMIDLSSSYLTEEETAQACAEAAAFYQGQPVAPEYFWFKGVSYRYYLSDGCGGPNPCPHVP